MLFLSPYNYTGEDVARWEYVNRHIKSDFKDRVKYIYDTCTMLDTKGDGHGNGKYNPHPDDESCMALAQDFVRLYKE